MVSDETVFGMVSFLGTMRPRRIMNLSFPATVSSSLSFLSTACCAFVKSGLKKMRVASLFASVFRLIASMARRFDGDFSLIPKSLGRPFTFVGICAGSCGYEDCVAIGPLPDVVV